MRDFNNKYDFGEATLANIMKFVYTEPSGVSSTSAVETNLDLAQQSGKLPDWVTNPDTPWTNKSLSKILRNHVTKLVSHFGDRCYSWDVVNETFSDNPAGDYASNIRYDTIGPEYVAMAFDAAIKAVKKHGSTVKLYYRDYNIENPNAKAKATENLVKQLKGLGIRTDGVGLDSHFIAGFTPSLAGQIARKGDYAALSVDTAVTELDVRLNLPPTADSETQQVLDYYNSVKSCVQVKQFIGIMVWNFDGTHSRIPSTFQGQGYGDMVLQPGGANHTWVKKAAYDGELEALMGKREVL